MEPLLRGHPFYTKNDLSKGVASHQGGGVRNHYFC